MTTKHNISIIIPVYNEILIIEELLDNLELFRDSCEIIFVDGGSKDGTDELIRKRYRLVYSDKKGRGNQMNYGAKLAQGDILFFLHADSQLEEDALLKIDRAIDRGAKVGCLKIVFDSRAFVMKICGFMSSLRVRLRNIAFGDQGIFIRKSYFKYLGGYRDQPLMEDYQLSMDIKEDGEKIHLIDSKIKTSDRRFVENGRLKTMARMQRLQHMYRRGQDIDLIARLYK